MLNYTRLSENHNFYNLDTFMSAKWISDNWVKVGDSFFSFPKQCFNTYSDSSVIGARLVRENVPDNAFGPDNAILGFQSVLNPKQYLRR